MFVTTLIAFSVTTIITRINIIIMFIKTSLIEAINLYIKYKYIFKVKGIPRSIGISFTSFNIIKK